MSIKVSFLSNQYCKQKKSFSLQTEENTSTKARSIIPLNKNDYCIGYRNCPHTIGLVTATFHQCEHLYGVTYSHSLKSNHRASWIICHSSFVVVVRQTADCILIKLPKRKFASVQSVSGHLTSDLYPRTF